MEGVRVNIRSLRVSVTRCHQENTKEAIVILERTPRPVSLSSAQADGYPAYFGVHSRTDTGCGAMFSSASPSPWPTFWRKR